jgi:hypothetical protein
MVWQFRTKARKVQSVFAWRGVCLVLAACLAMIEAGQAHAVTHGSVNAAFSHAQTGQDLIRVGVCSDGSYGCSDHPRRPAPPPDGHVSRWEPYPGPPVEPYYTTDEYELPPHIEPLPPCEPVEYASHGYVRDALPPREPYIGYDEDYCGVRCWYRRLKAGYCGRGCDYYNYRLHAYQPGSLRRYGPNRFACRSAY